MLLKLTIHVDIDPEATLGEFGQIIRAAFDVAGRAISPIGRVRSTSVAQEDRGQEVFYAANAVAPRQADITIFSQPNAGLHALMLESSARARASEG